MIINRNTTMRELFKAYMYGGFSLKSKGGELIGQRVALPKASNEALMKGARQ